MSKVRVNITVDSDTLAQAKRKLSLFGGKLSTLFDAYLRDFVASSHKSADRDSKDMVLALKELEIRVGKLERESAK